MASFPSPFFALVAAFGLAICGFAWLAIAMEKHWHQVQGSAILSARSQLLLRLAGGGAILVALTICALSDGLAMALLVWMMLLPAAAGIVALTLSIKPAALRWFFPAGART